LPHGVEIPRNAKNDVINGKAESDSAIMTLLNAEGSSARVFPEGGMFSPLLPIGALVFCLACVVSLVHQQKESPSKTRWIDYLALASTFAGATVFVIGAGLSA
jgi:hypothetical protein